VFERAQTNYLVRRVFARINWCNFHYIKSTVIYFWETLLRDDTIFTVHLHRLRRPVATVEGKYGIFRASTYYHSNSFWCSFSILAYSTALRRRRAREIAPSYWLRAQNIRALDEPGCRTKTPGDVLHVLDPSVPRERRSPRHGSRGAPDASTCAGGVSPSSALPRTLTKTERRAWFATNSSSTSIAQSPASHLPFTRSTRSTSCCWCRFWWWRWLLVPAAASIAFFLLRATS